MPAFDIHAEFHDAIAAWCLGGFGVMFSVLLVYSLQPGEIVERHGVRPNSVRSGSTDERRESVGGEIWVDSEPGDGSTFSVTLPAVNEEYDDRASGVRSA